MNKIARRAFLRMLPVSAFAGRQAAEHAAKELAGLARGSAFPPSAGLADAFGINNNTVAAEQASGRFLDQRVREFALRNALATPALRAEIEAILYDQHRTVHALDHDLASNRSYSLAAKICYQRQRNVARALECQVMEASPWQRIRDWADRICRLAGVN